MSCGDMTSTEGWNLQLQGYIKRLRSALSELVETVEVYELDGEIDAGCGGEGPVQRAKDILRETEKL